MDQSSLSPTQHYISFATDGSGSNGSLKCHYRKQLILRILECYDENKDCDISLLDAVVLLKKSWRLVTESTIRDCFRNVGLMKTQQTEDDRTPPHIPVPDAMTATVPVGWTQGGLR
ncbi:hypothetical protein AVEN_262209-1 [Araneus ventricosus]|uniref:DDE-1 domain-containing protein n=1 Tax=Araneus ventricosus TaxID=182803 RepID=A0A4Y2MP77_ARAVE|nr:hypothetical protein AVEN_262209-1 [Araneus ventricosus]